MKYVLIILLVLALLGGNVQGIIINENKMNELGFSPISITSSNQMACDSFSFLADDTYFLQGNDTMVRFGAVILPFSEKDANVTLYLNQNEEPEHLFTPSDVHPDSKMITWRIASSHLIKGENTITICGKASPSTESITLSPGTIGLYQQARFDEEGSFATYVVGNNPILGVEIPIQLYLHNDGAESTLVKVDYRKYELDYVPLLKGETGFQDTLGKEESRTITYYIKPLHAVSILLPPAVLTYTTIFGEKITQYSTRAYLEVAPPAFNVSGAFLIPANRVRVGETTTIDWVVQNEGIDTIHGINAQFFVQPNNGVKLSPLTIDSLSPAKAVSRSFSIVFQERGTYEIGCTLYSMEDASLTTNCRSVTIEVVEENTGIALLFSLLLLFIAVGVYTYIYILPDKKPSIEEKKKKRRFQHVE
ncbi:MAG: hypothetical protein V1776_04365 [Candidatus Diapherotrites archaeon]